MRPADIAQHVETWTILALTALLPFFVVPLAWFTVPQSKLLLLAVAALVAALAYGVGAYYRDEVEAPRSVLFYALASVPLAYLLSALFSTGGSASFVGGLGQSDTVFAMGLLLALCFVAIHTYARSSQRVVAGVRALGSGAVLLFVLEFVHLAFPQATFGGIAGDVTFNFLGSSHDLGIFAAFSLFLFLMYLSTPIFSGALWRGVAALGMLLSAIVLLLLELPDVWFGCAFLAAAYVVYLWQLTPEEEKPRVRTLLLLWSALAIACAALAFAAPIVADHLPASLNVMQIEVSPSWQSTFQVGRSALSGPREILFGTGPNSFARDWNLYKPAAINTTAFWNAQFNAGAGSVPTSFVTVGLLGVLSWGFVLLALLFALVRTYFIAPGRAALARVPLVMLAVFLFVFHILYAPSAALAALLWLTGALLISLNVHAGRVRRVVLRGAAWQNIAASIALMAGVAATLFVSVSVIKATISDAYVDRAALALAQNDPGSAGAYVATAISYSQSNDRAQREAATIGLSELSALIAAGATSTSAQLSSTLDATISHGLAAVSLNGGDSQNWLALADIYAQLAGAHVSGADASARQAYTRAAAAAPADPAPHLMLGQLDLLVGSTTDARAELERALALKPDIALAYYLLSQIDAEKGDLQAAQQEALQAAQLAPQDPIVLQNLGAVLYAQQDYTDAVAALEQAVALQSNYGNALVLLGLSYDKLGEKDKALSTLESAAALDPSNAAVQAMLTNIKNGKDALATTTTPSPKPAKKK
jgi:tetratricopeptide (TPR) repeat protein